MQTLSSPHILLNIIFTSIPEEAFIAIITLIFLKLNNLLDIYTWNKSLKWIALAVLPVSIMINILKYIIIVPPTKYDDFNYDYYDFTYGIYSYKQQL